MGIWAGTHVRALLFDKYHTAILMKYFDYNNLLLVGNIIEPSEYFQINNYAIKLKENK